MPTGVGGQKKRAVRCAGLLRRRWSRLTRNDRTTASGRIIVGRKGTCGMANIMVLVVRAAPRGAQAPETTGRMPLARTPRESNRIARVRTVHTQSVLLQTVRVPTVRTRTVPGRRHRDWTARRREAEGQDVQVPIVGSSSLPRVGALLNGEVLAALRNRVASS